MPLLDPETQRLFAVEIVERLRAEGFTAYWAGGCVRDRLMGALPKDYDVATDATPREIRRQFRDFKTLAVGAAFGTITVVGPRGAGHVEVTTFRQDAAYSDGRHPDAVTFTDARQDASRRDFTINGLFFDPIGHEVIDFVGGQEDLRRRLVRAIGDPHARFREDKLRMLRAVRFASVLQFTIEAGTLAAIREMANELAVVSPERIAAEMQRTLVDRHRAGGVRLLVESGLARVVLPEVLGRGAEHEERLAWGLAVMERLDGPSFALALAALLGQLVDAPAAREVCRRWRLANQITDRTGWLVEHRESLRGATSMRWSALQPLLVHEGAADLIALGEAAALAGFGRAADAEFCRRMRERPPEELDPPPLVTGDDLLALGVPSGPVYRAILRRVRNAQLDGNARSKDEALAMAAAIVASGGQEDEGQKDKG